MSELSLFFLWLFGLVIVINLLSAASMYVQLRQIQRKKEKYNARTSNHSESDERQDQTVWHAIAARIHAIGNHLHAQSEQQDRQDRGRATRENRTLIVIGITAVFAFGSDWIFYLQLKAMKSDQRPWLGLGYVGYPPDGPYQLGFINGGKSPAIDVAIWAKVIPSAFSETPTLPSGRCTIDCKVDGITLIPNVPYQMKLLIQQVGINPPTFANTAAWIIGRADYKDVDGIPHKTGVCLFHRPEERDLVACPMPNSNYAE